jgi:nucleotide-binding universal stress UspA family protein
VPLLPINKILVPTDFSKESQSALQAASELARAFACELTLLYVFEPVFWPAPEGYVVYTAEQMTKLLAESQRRLDDAKKECEQLGAKANTALIQGIIGPTIVEHAEEGKFDLIVMGTHGRTGLGHALIGSIAEKIVRTAKCPVLTVRP